VSGISGIFSLCRMPVRHVALANMMQCLAHRGSHGSSHWTEGGIGLCGQRLCATPQSIHETVLFKTNRGHVIVADARLDNRDELTKSLEIETTAGGKPGDAEIICRAYLKWDTECPVRLLGDFSFAIWDAANEKLFCARDRFGVKPFYFYHNAQNAFVFASEIKALLATNLVPLRLNEQRVAQYLRSDLRDQQITFYQDVQRLEPAHCLTVSAGRIQCRRYWSLDSVRELERRSDEDFEAGFRDRFWESVRVRTASGGPVGAMLSGGLDSSSVTCIANRVLHERGLADLHTFSAVFDDVPESDERNYIFAVLAREPVSAHFLRGDALSPLMNASGDFYCHDEPFYIPNLFIHQEIFEMARTLGVRVILDGFDGDVVISHGVAFLREMAGQHRWLQFTRELKALAARLQCSPWNLVRQELLSRVVPTPVKTAIRYARGVRGDDPSTSRILNQDFARRIHGRRIEGMQRFESTAMPTNSREAHFAGLTSGAIPLALEAVDRAAAACGVEPRYPFFDSRLVEYCLALPGDQKLRSGWTRSVLRRSLKDILPAQVCWRGTKSDLSPNFARALITFDRKFIDRLLANRGAPVWDYANITTIRAAYQRMFRRNSHVDSLQVWKAVTLGQWLERFSLTKAKSQSAGAAEN
jgi:asparagine synthase (glutamine-hydrolysing)